MILSASPIVLGTPVDDLIVKTDGLITLGDPASETIVYANVGHVAVNGVEGDDTIRGPGSGALGARVR